VNQQRRIIFIWYQNDALDAQLVDYHCKKKVMEKLKNIHPGEVLLEEFLVPLEITPYRLAKETFLPQTRISEILKGNRRITADTALRFAKYFGNTAKFWLMLQDDYDLEHELELKESELKEIKPFKT
jgi:addiction module HigA family antidote